MRYVGRSLVVASAIGLSASVLCPDVGRAQVSTTYAYDALGRLKTVTNAGGVTTTYSYDAAGNRSQVVVGGVQTGPASFDLGAPASGATAGAWILSAAPVLSGFSGALSISVTGGQYRIDGGAWQTAAGTVSAGQSVQVQVQAPTAGGTSQTATLNVGGVTDTFQVTTAADMTPDAIAALPSVSGSSDVPDAYFGHEYRRITGITTPITLRVERYGYSGDADVAELLALRSPDAQAWTSIGPVDARQSGYAYVDFNVSDGDYIGWKVRAGTSSGRKTASMQVVVWNLSAPTGPAVISDTPSNVIIIDADNNYGIDDITPDAFSNFTDQTAVTNEPTIFFGPSQTVTGINQPIVLRVERYNYSGDLSEIYVHVYRDNGSGWVQQGTFDPRDTSYQYIDVPVSNGDKIKYTVGASTYEGRKTGTMNMVAWNLSQPGGAVQLSSRTVSVTVDNDDNYYNIGPCVPPPGQNMCVVD